MTFRVRAFNQTGQETAVTDPFLSSLASNSGQNPFLSDEDIDAQVRANQPRADAARELSGGLGDLLRSLTGGGSAQGSDLTTAPPVSSSPSPIEGISSEASGLLEDFYRDQGERDGLTGQFDALIGQAERLAAPLRSSAGGRSQSTNTLLDALESGGIESFNSAFIGLTNRRNRIGELTSQAQEVQGMLAALDADGSSPTQALRDFIRHAPTVDGVNIPSINPESETPEDVFSIVNQAIYADAADGEAQADGRANSGYSGVIGTNLDGWQTLLNSNKVTLDEQGLAVNFDQFEAVDYVDYFGLEMRFITPLGFDEASDEEKAAIVAREVIAADPTFADLSAGEARTIVSAIIDRVDSAPNLASVGEGLNEWLAVQTYFQG